MLVSSWGVLKSKTGPVVLIAVGLVACSSTPDQPLAVKADKPFAAGGTIEMQLEAGSYVVRAAPDDRIRVSFGGNTGNASAELTTNGANANLTVRDTPHNNFRATLEVPQTADLTLHMTAGNLDIAGVTGNKDIDSKAGNVTVSVPNPNDYGSVDGSVKVGDVNAGPFGNSSSGLSPHLTWSGPGKYKLHATLGAGNLELKH
jgi:hypothetical protein